ncbi:hypothetical protein [Olleya sp. HaHaR_3_96]|uniref:hypothetical protein n=1 Tax=Olleya sp. HaHaR_3_96 TaxID=2745560 RepID=UPI001C4E7286|nr:hypothetical protein [Olleya sp. HaHaR_3_96]QXP58559.1 hypothetical protein H0I26_11585 [Olleya sp. HaHaR_3_96]
MTKRVFFTFITLIIFSCNSDEYKLKIKQLEQNVSKKEKEIKSLKKSNNVLSSVEESLRIKIANNLVKKEELSFLIKPNSWLSINNKKMLEFFLETTNFKKNDVESAIKNSWMIHPGYGDKYPFANEEFFANHMISKIDRSSESLEKIITPEIKKLIYTVFKQNNLYKDCGAYSMVKSSLLAYESFKDSKDVLSQIYQIASESDINHKTIKSIISSLVTNEILDTLNDLNYSNYPKKYSTEESRLITIYTFWARRYNENNLEFTHTILQELHQNITNEEF